MLQDFSDFLWQLLIFQWELRTRLFCIIFVKSADTRFCSIICVEIIQSFIRKVSRTLFRTFALGEHQHTTCHFFEHFKIIYQLVCSFMVFANELRLISDSSATEHSDITLSINTIPFHIHMFTFTSMYS